MLLSFPVPRDLFHFPCTHSNLFVLPSVAETAITTPSSSCRRAMGAVTSPQHATTRYTHTHTHKPRRACAIISASTHLLMEVDTIPYSEIRLPRHLMQVNRMGQSSQRTQQTHEKGEKDDRRTTELDQRKDGREACKQRAQARAEEGRKEGRTGQWSIFVLLQSR